MGCDNFDVFIHFVSILGLGNISMLSSWSFWLLLFVHSTFGGLYTVTRLTRGSGIKLRDQWNLKNVYCGNYTAGLYRNDYIDNPDIACISALYLFYDDNSHYIKYVDPPSIQIEDWMPSRAAYSWRGVPATSDNFIASNFYDYLWLNGSNDTFWAGIYYNEGATESPLFPYSHSGVPFTDAISPSNIIGIQMANNLEIVLATKDGCDVPSTSKHIENCPGSGPPLVINPVTNITVSLGDEAVIECSYASYHPVVEIQWIFTNTSQVTHTITSNIDTIKYNGSTVSSPTLTVRNVGAADLGNYTCRARSRLGWGDGGNIELRISMSAPSVTVTETSYKLEFGTDTKINCSYTSYPNADSVFWKKNGSLLGECGILGRLGSSSVDNPSLDISNTEFCDCGIYECCVVNSVSTTCSDTVILRATPIVSVSPSPTIVWYGVTSTVNCTIESFPGITHVAWNITTSTGTTYFDNFASSSRYAGSSIVSPSLDILSPEFSDVGQYVCIGKNEAGFTSSLPVNVIVYGIVINLPATNYSVLHGDDLEFICNITAIPGITTVTWYISHDGLNKSKINMNNTIKYGGSTPSYPSLRINQVTFNDDAYYSCSAENTDTSQCEDSSFISVTVTGALPVVMTSHTSITVNQSQSITLSCVITSLPLAHAVYWKKISNGVLTTITSTTTGGTLSSPSLVFPSVDLIDTGEYICFAENSIGVGNSSAVWLNVNQVEELCPCSCAFKNSSPRNTTNYTLAELYVLLAPTLKKLDKELKVDKKNLSSYINKHVSAPDHRISSRSLGLCGAISLFLVVFGIVFMDLSSVSRHVTTVRNICKGTYDS